MDITIDQKTYDEYLKEKNTIHNERIRPDDENFFDAIMSVDMEKHPDGKKIMEMFKDL